MRTLLHTACPVLAAGFVRLFEAEGSAVETSTGDVSELIGKIEGWKPSVVLLDVPAQVEYATIAELRRRVPDSHIVLWVYSITVEAAHHVRKLGVRGVLRKDLQPDLLVRCLRKVSVGEMWFERSLLESMLHVREVRLSPRERQLLRLVAKGLSNKQLAGSLMIAEGTVKVYLAKLFKKVGIHDRFELALYGLRNISSEADAAAAVEQDLGVRSLIISNSNSH